MPRGTEKPSEFKRYQQALAVVYVAVIGAGTLLLAASVVRELLFRPVAQLPFPDAASANERAAISAAEPSAEIRTSKLLRCHREVSALLDQLNAQASTRLRAPIGPLTGPDDERALPADWQPFAASWRQRWSAVNAWCRFSELSHTHMGEAYDRMAEVHATLSVIELKYQSLLARFERELAADLVDLQRSLGRSRRLLSDDLETQGTDHERAR